MSGENGGRIDSLYRYPLKGFSGERLDEAAVEAGKELPFDRAYAIENGPGRFRADDPQHLPKINFLMLMRNARIASVATTFDAPTHTLTILRDGKQVARGDLSSPTGRQMVEQFIAAYFKDDLRGAPKIVHAPGHSFSDVNDKCLHIVNLESLRDMERRIGRELSPLRFRANVYLDGLPAWAERQWIDCSISLGDVSFDVLTNTTRCEAVNVSPSTATRDVSLTAALERELGHCEFGVYARVKSAGVLRAGDKIGSVS